MQSAHASARGTRSIAGARSRRTPSPRALAWALCTLHLHLSPHRELAIVGDVRADVARAALSRFDPATVVAVGPADDVPLLAGRSLVEGATAVYLCERFACRAPVTRPEELDS